MMEVEMPLNLAYKDSTCMYMLSHVQLLATAWTVAHEAPLSMEFSRQEYWSGLPFPTPEDLSDPRMNLRLLCLLRWQVDS